MVGAKMKNEWTKRIEELEAENRRLVALNDTFPPEIARLEDRVSAEYEAERADDRARIRELEAENAKLRELVDGAKEIVEIANCTSPAQREWKAAWLKKAAKAMKEASHD
jgi:predicted nuclease with TOPRIM domain